MITDNKEVIIMSEVTSPIMTDATGQSIVSKLDSLLGKMDILAAAFQPNASGIVYSNSTSGLTGDDVQEAIDEVAADITEINTNLTNYIKIKSILVNKADLATNIDLSTYVSPDSGYKFLCWQVSGTSNGWITSMPIYISVPGDIKGRPFWHPNLTIGGAVNFYYLEIKDV